jgi:murein DD-endopeptidase MepM/ murein hydrolase activator NlpD
LMAGRFERVSSEFSLARINPVTGVNQSHSGIDLVSKDFGAPVLAWADGKVVDTVQSESGCGWEVWIQHRKGWDSRYCHLSGINVKPGQMVQAGQKIASVGSTGNSTGEHLHFEVRLQSQLLDPRRVFKAQSVQGG